MEIDQIRILNILEEISHRDHTSQRELSKKLNISLGLVNSFVKRLVRKGYFKVSTLPKNRLRYILTPKGVTEKTRLSYEYLQFSLEFYKCARDKIFDVLQELTQQSIQSIVIYGSGELAEILYVLLQQTEIELSAVIDPIRFDERFMDRTLMNKDDLASLSYDKIVITELGEGQSVDRIAATLRIPLKKFVLIQ